MTKEAHIAQLAVKYIISTLSEPEHEELMQWLNASPEHRQLFDTYTQPDFIGREYKNRTQRRERLNIRISEFGVSPDSMTPVSTSYTTADRVHLLKTSWFRYAAAVVLIAGAATAIGVLTNQPEQVATTDNNKPLQTDIAPGGDKAVLTLADGSTIVLDNAANGNLAQQGNTKIIKLDNGQLAYNVGNTLSKEILYNTISTPRGGQYQIVLPDGSKVWLNAASSIKFPTSFSGTERNVTITGEAYMEIAKNTKMPFTVNANGMEVKILGTSFNINAYEDESTVKTTLVEGSVKVKSGDRESILTPGQQAEIDNNHSIKINDNTDIGQVLAWKNGMFQFKRATIPEILRQLSRWYDVDIVYQGNVPERRFEGEMQRDLPLSSALRILELSKIRFKLEGKTLIVLPSAK